jgi:diguanylate cyclase (GGDEF)-like protein
MLAYAGRLTNHIGRTAKTALLGPQILTFVPALTLGGYWFGGEGVLLFMAIFLPALLGLVGLFTPMQPSTTTQGPVDAITRLPLRSALLALLDKAFCEEPKNGLRTAAMALAIDDFAALREQHGDTAAERILEQVALRFDTTLRHGDIASRLDAATFAIALAPARRVDLESMIQLSARLQQSIAAPILVDGMRLHITVSIGFCLPRTSSEKSAAACLDAAESALADAQSCGTGAIRAYSVQTRRKRVIRTGLVCEIANALESDQIKPWFQPQISTDTGEISGIEALARWEHPERGVILPGAFLPAISTSGLNERLSEVILYNSLTALKNWDKAGLNLPNVSVNFSGEELSDPKLCDKIRWELDRFDLAPPRLTVEVLETVIARSQSDTITRNIAQLAEMGCGVDLDDFGTGHASIANIRRFSINRIKIDRSFVTRIDCDRDQQQMLTAILEMAGRLNIATLAEGVETVGEHALLSQLGCDHVQGYSIARPMPFSETAAWISSYSAKLVRQSAISRQIG